MRSRPEGAGRALRGGRHALTPWLSANACPQPFTPGQRQTQASRPCPDAPIISPSVAWVDVSRKRILVGCHLRGRGPFSS
jgi:hypothetical protein